MLADAIGLNDAVAAATNDLDMERRISRALAECVFRVKSATDSGMKSACAGRSQRDPAGEGPAQVRCSEPPGNECCGCDR